MMQHRSWRARLEVVLNHLDRSATPPEVGSAPSSSCTSSIGPAGAEVASLRVVTLNLNVHLPSGEQSDTVVRHAIANERPDLICFQEALWWSREGGEWRHQAQPILHGLGYHIVHQFEVQHRIDTNPAGLSYGTVIASRWPITRSDVVQLPSTERGAKFRRALQAAQIDVPQPVGALLLVNPKPHYEPHMELEREMQAVAIADYVQLNADSEGFPPIIATDMDAPPDASSMRFLTGLQSLNGRSTHFVDAWRAAGNRSPGYTHTCDHPLGARIAAENFREVGHRRRLDYILLGGPVQYSKYAQVTACRVILDEPVDGVWATGHYGVLADIATVQPSTVS